MTEAAPVVAGVVGWPVAHSRSPRLHGHWLSRYGINGHYVPLAVRPEDFEPAFRALPRLGFRGVNVTIPHKEMALACATEVSARAAAIGAANTFTFGLEGGIHADNTDGLGFLENLRHCLPGWSAAAGPALVLGAGGAARAVVWALLEDGAPEVRLANRTRSRADALRAQYGEGVKAVDWAEAGDAAAGAALVVNTTSLGMTGGPALDFPTECVPRDAVVTDLVYQPLITPFLAAAEARGLRIVDGLGMLLHQAVPGFERWFGRRPEVDAGLQAAVLGA